MKLEPESGKTAPPLPPLGYRGMGRGRMRQLKTLDVTFSDGHRERALEGDRNGIEEEARPGRRA